MPLFSKLCKNKLLQNENVVMFSNETIISLYPVNNKMIKLLNPSTDFRMQLSVSFVILFALKILLTPWEPKKE